MAVAYARVAGASRRRRRIGFTSFLKMPRWLAGQQTGVRDSLSAGSRIGNEPQSMTVGSLAPYLLVAAPPVGEISVSCLIVTAVQTRSSQCVSRTLFFSGPHQAYSGGRSRSRVICARKRRSFNCGFAPPNCSGRTHSRRHSVPGVVRLRTRHLEQCAHSLRRWVATGRIATNCKAPP